MRSPLFPRVTPLNRLVIVTAMAMGIVIVIVGVMSAPAGVVPASSSGSSSNVAEATIPSLIDHLNAHLPKGWTASYDEKEKWVDVERTEQALTAYPALPNANFSEEREAPQLRTVAFGFVIVPNPGLDQYKRLTAENGKMQFEMGAILDKIEDREHLAVPGSFHVIPGSDPDGSLKRRYYDLKQSIHHLPDHYYRDIGLDFRGCLLVAMNEQIQYQLEGVEAAVRTLLATVPDPE